MRMVLAGAAALGLLLATGEQVEARRRGHPAFPSGGHIRGHLVDPAGKGITGVIGLRTAAGCLISLHHSDSEERGRFVLDNLYPGTYMISVEAVPPVISDLQPGDRVLVEVVAGRISRPVIVPRCEPHVPIRASGRRTVATRPAEPAPGAKP